MLRSIYDIADADLTGEFVDQLTDDLQHNSCSVEVRSLGRTVGRWWGQIVAGHQALVSNGPTEAITNLIKHIGLGFRRYRIQVLLYAGKPNWDLLSTVTPHQKSDTPLHLGEATN